MAVNPIRRRYPKALWDQYLSAERDVSHLTVEQRFEYLARYRRNRIKRIAVLGINPINYPLKSLELDRTLEDIPVEELSAIKKLDEAFSAIHRFREPGGAEEYMSHDVYKAMESYRASQIARKPRKAGRKEIAQFLTKRGYQNLSNGEKKQVRELAQRKFDVSDSTISRAVFEYGIGRKKKLSVAS